MRAVFIGTPTLAIVAAETLRGRGHDVVMVEQDKTRIEELSERLDVGFLHGDGTRPDVLADADPGNSDCLFCLTNNDQANIIASLVGRSLGFKRVVTGIKNADFDRICIELGLTDTIVPAVAIGRYLADMFEGQGMLELSAMVKGDARVFSFTIREAFASPAELQLPDDARPFCVYRGDELLLPDADTRLASGDEILVITHRRHLEKLQERFGPGVRGRKPPLRGESGAAGEDAGEGGSH